MFGEAGSPLIPSFSPVGRRSTLRLALASSHRTHAAQFLASGFLSHWGDGQGEGLAAPRSGGPLRRPSASLRFSEGIGWPESDSVPGTRMLDVGECERALISRATRSNFRAIGPRVGLCGKQTCGQNPPRRLCARLLTLRN